MAVSPAAAAVYLGADGPAGPGSTASETGPGGPAGDAADSMAALAAPLANASWVGAAIDGTRYPRTAAYVDAILARPSLADLVAKDAATVRGMMAA